MYPELRFVLLSTQATISLHGLAVVIGVGAGAALALRRAREPAPALLSLALVTVAALAGAHALFRILHGGPGLLWSGGLSSMGGVAAGLVATWAVARLGAQPASELLDALVPAGLLALGIGRIGCFLGGCCFGSPTALPWGVVFPELSPPPRHPLQLYSAAADLLLVALLPRTAVPGRVARRGCVGFGLARAGLECLRDPAATDLLPGGWLTLPQALALALAGGAALVPRLRLRGASTMPPARRTSAHGR